MRPVATPSERLKRFFDEIHCQKWDFKPMYFAQKCPQNAGNAVSETQISKDFQGDMPPAT